MTHPYQEMLQFTHQTFGIHESADILMTPVGKGGSIRSFYRIRYGDNSSAVFMHYDRNTEENSYYETIAEFLRKIDIPVPLIMAHDSERGFIIMKDLGDADLWSFRHEPWAKRREYYCKVLSIIYKLHTFSIDKFSSERVPLMEEFGPKLYRWERDYFIEHFVQNVCEIELCSSDRDNLEEELKGLSDRLENIKPCLVHRDFQSQNIMICNNIPVLIDFQGMRFGNLFYDLGSLLYDPYVSLTDEERMELLQYYYFLWTSNNTEMKNAPRQQDTLPLVRMYFLEMFWEASVQRLMQALGAYGFLGLKRGIPEFLTHISRGVANLIDAATHTKKLPLLKDLALRCQQVSASRQPIRRL